MIKRIIFSLVLSTFVPFSLFSSSFIVKFKTIESKKKFLPFIEKSLKCTISDLPIRTSIENILNSKGQNLTLNDKKHLTDFLTYSILDLESTSVIDEFYRNLETFEIEYVEPNFKVTLDELNINDNLFKEQWYIDAINVKTAWKFAKGKGIKIGIVDTGLDFDNKEFYGRIWINSKEDANGNGTFEPWSDTTVINGISGDLNGIDDDGNGFVDDVIGYDFVNQLVGNFGDYVEPDPIPYDEHSHGTLVAGVLSAGMNDTGIVGIAPEAKLVVLRAFDVTGNAEVKDIASAIIYAGLNKVNVLNLSFGTNYNSRLLKDAIKFAADMGCILVASAGNDGEIVEHYPSDYSEVISAGATTKLGQIGKSSNYGPSVDIFAPGYEILTTTIGNSYKYVSGTSFSAPIVSGVIALLLEVKPDLRAEEIKAIIKSTQTPLKDKRSINQGIINAGDAVTFLGASKVEITHPFEMQEFDKKKFDKIGVVYSIFSPLFDSFDISLNTNDTVFVANLLVNQKIQRLNDTFWLNISGLANGIYTLLLKVHLKSGNTFTTSRKFTIFSSDSNIVLNKSDLIYTIYETKLLPIYVSISNLPTFCIVYAYHNDKILNAFTDNLYGTHHFIPIDALTDGNFTNEIYLKIEQKTNSGLVLFDTLIINGSTKIKQKSLIEKYEKLPLSYVFDKPVKLKQFSKDGIIINPYKNLEWNNLEFYIFEDSLFKKVANYPKAFIPVDIGNTNGDDFDEILTTSFGRTIIFEPKRLNEFFGNILFESKSDEILWGSKLFDLDNDGKDEFIGFNNNSIQIYKNLAGKFNLVYQITPRDTFGLVGTKPNIQIADLDGDGFLELAFFTTNGYLLIYQFDSKNSIFTLEFFTKIYVDPFSISSCLAILPGMIEQTLCFVGGSSAFQDNFAYEYSTIWKLHTLRCKGFNSYEVKEEICFWGARIGATPQGIFYRNGITNGNVDNQNGDELLLSLFPNLYVLSYDEKSDQFFQILWLPYSYSNSVIVGDFDQNGINEFGFSRWDGLTFFELTNVNVLDVPSNVDGWVGVDDTILIKWDKVENANLYQVFELNKSTNKLQLFGSAKENFLKAKRNFNFGERIFFVRAIDTLGFFSPSGFSNPIVIYETTLTTPLTVYVLNDRQFLVSFSGKVGSKFLPYKETILYNELGEIVKIASISCANDTSLIFSIFDEFRNGRYFLNFESFRDAWGNFTAEKGLEFIYEKKIVPDSLLIFERYFFTNRLSLEIHFPTYLDYSSAKSLNNYSIKPFGKIRKVEVEGKVIKIELTDEPNIYSLGRDFYLSLGKIYSSDSTRFVQPPYNTISLTRQAEDIENAFAYPNPLNLNKTTEIVFANVPNGAKIEIFDQTLSKIYELENTGWRGGVSFDLLQTSRNFSPGIYYFRVGKEANGNWTFSTLKKFAIVK